MKIKPEYKASLIVVDNYEELNTPNKRKITIIKATLFVILWLPFAIIFGDYFKEEKQYTILMIIILLTLTFIVLLLMENKKRRGVHLKAKKTSCGIRIYSSESDYNKRMVIEDNNSNIYEIPLEELNTKVAVNNMHAYQKVSEVYIKDVKILLNGQECIKSFKIISRTDSLSRRIGKLSDGFIIAGTAKNKDRYSLTNSYDGL